MNFYELKDEPAGVYLARGAYLQSSTQARVTDPCYDKDDWCGHTIEGVRPGKWKAFIYLDPEERRVARLMVHHDGLPEAPDGLEWIWKSAGVDSGQCGVFDEAKFKDDFDLAVPDVSLYPVWYEMAALDRLEGVFGEMNEAFKERVDDDYALRHYRLDFMIALEGVVERNRGYRHASIARRLSEARYVSEFYPACCALTSSLSGAAHEYGAVSGTGLGDGGYPIRVKKDGDDVVAIEIVYMMSEEGYEAYEQAEYEAGV